MHVFQGVCFKMSPECTVFQLKSTPTFYPRGPELRALDGRTRSPDESGAKTVHSEDILQSGRKNRAFRGHPAVTGIAETASGAKPRIEGGILIGIVFAEAVNQRKTVHPGNIPSDPRPESDCPYIYVALWDPVQPPTAMIPASNAVRDTINRAGR